MNQYEPYKAAPFITITIISLLVSMAGYVVLWERPQAEAASYSATKQYSTRDTSPRGPLKPKENDAIKVFREVSPSVVFITNAAMARDFFSMRTYETPQGSGSGFVWDKKGRILTNFHVIMNASRIEVTLNDGSKWEAKIIGTARDKDVAVLQINAPAEKLHPIKVGDSKDLQVGQTVYAIGNPFGLDTTMTSGIVSALNREIKSLSGRTIQGVIQTDAAINPGNSGGPLLDSAGRLIGINTQIISPSGASSGIGFAVPVETANQAASQIIAFGKVIRPGLGVTLARDGIARQYGFEGVLILEVVEGGGAQRAGLKGSKAMGNRVILGDIIRSVDGVPVRSYDDLGKVLDNHKVGDTVEVEILRGGSVQKTPVTLIELE